jgi:hypothetical protein
MKMILVAAVIGLAACGGAEATVNADGDWSFASDAVSVRMDLVQDGETITGNALKTDTVSGATAAGAIAGFINGPENVNLTVSFDDGMRATMLAAGLPSRMFGTFYLNGKPIIFEATRAPFTAALGN